MAAGEGSPAERLRRRWLATELGARVVSALVSWPLPSSTAYRGGWPFALFWLAAGIAVLGRVDRR